ncbi:hypothetical protein [Streptomyces diastatochromogenes]|uniref:Uncharacterized protein n=1 Tax=Streptomyces diastatochromogenes TaxID=42236 RepID=A0A233SNV4_STRDA|nr:hypothetical protein [Streptomyces diastatochromogenes]MCZ0986992.1 hypothetical protein [Streptomyces diastatochromogenes]OXY97305.1 hypothetical protein BEK98_10340 [Streptomyces diastatochromogenes]
MNTLLTTAAFLILIAAAAFVIHRLTIEHAERIAVHRYSRALPGGPCRFPPRRRRDRATHHG